MSIDERYTIIRLQSMMNCGNGHSGTSNSPFCYEVNLARCTGCLCAWIECSAPPWVDLPPSKMRSTNHICSHNPLLTWSISFDLDLPVDCDDEYWDHPDPEQRFKQPANKPSSVKSFILTIKLQQILAVSLRTIVSDPSSNASELIQS